MTPALIILLILIAVIAVAVGLIAERNRMELIDPQTLIIPFQDELPERFLPLEGAVNFRDVGGYRTADGHRVRTGRVYRSAALHRLTEKDHAYLQQLGVKLVCDLRSVEEITAEPDLLPQNPAPEYLHLPLTTDDSRDQRERFMALLFNRRKLMGMMADFYVRVMLEDNANLYGTIFKRLANPENLPAVFHCTAGKDRTGMAAALLLSLLGVPEDTILADYSLSNRYYDNYFRYGQRMVAPLKWLGVRAEHLQPLIVANPENLRLALQHIHDKYGSVEQYLRNKAGLTDADIAALRTNFLE